MLFFFPETTKTSRNLFRLDKNGVTVNISVPMPRVQTQLRTPLKSSPRQFFLLQILLCKVNVALIACILLNGAIFFSFLLLLLLFSCIVDHHVRPFEDAFCRRYQLHSAHCILSRYLILRQFSRFSQSLMGRFQTKRIENGVQNNCATCLSPFFPQLYR